MVPIKTELQPLSLDSMPFLSIWEAVHLEAFIRQALFHNFDYNLTCLILQFFIIIFLYYF